MAQKIRTQQLYKLFVVGIICFCMGFICSTFFRFGSESVLNGTDEPAPINLQINAIQQNLNKKTIQYGNTQHNIYHNIANQQEQEQLSMTTTDDSMDEAYSVIDDISSIEIIDGGLNGKYAVPSMASLVLLGPPKCGTRTFQNTLSKYKDVIQWGSERDFWCGANQWRCFPNMTNDEWDQYLDDLNHGKTNLSYIITIIEDVTRARRNKKCTIDRYQSFWIELNLTQKQLQFEDEYNFQNKECIHPKYALKKYNKKLRKDITTTSNKINWCHFIEKGPLYSRVAWIPIIFANYLPKTKLLTILRNPIYHVMSSMRAFGIRDQEISDSKQKVIRMIDKHESFGALTEICNEINDEWNKYDKQGIIGKERYLKLKHTVYKKFIMEYFYRRFVDPRDIQYESPRRYIMVWAPFTFPVFLTALFVYDEILSNNENINEWKDIESYKVIQFEWMYEDTPNAMKLIKCWMMGLHDDECHNYDGHKHLFTHINKTNHVRNATLVHEYDKIYQDNIHRLFDPCYTSMKNIIFYDRPNLLLGEWNSWDYRYSD